MPIMEANVEKQTFDGVMWLDPQLTPEQNTKCMLLDIWIYRAGSGVSQSPENHGKYVITRVHVGEYVRPITRLKFGNHIYVNSIDECFELAINPEKFGGVWRE